MKYRDSKTEKLTVEAAKKMTRSELLKQLESTRRNIAEFEEKAKRNLKKHGGSDETG